jgi:hypothetical protein
VSFRLKILKVSTFWFYVVYHSFIILICFTSEGLGNAEISPPKGQSAPGGKPSMVLYGESEELNRVVVLTLARAIHINGLEQQSIPWVKEVLSNIMNKTPHSWPSHTLKGFPAILQDFYNDNPGMPQYITGQILTLEKSCFYFLIETFVIAVFFI